jgi:hypothetical protein|tara:strand:+ start:5691 stop:6104 length:414 start_codon:yes stop_codon:yes gene_type:complete
MPKRKLKKNILNLNERSIPSQRVSFSLKIETPEDDLANRSISVDLTPQDFSFKNGGLENEFVENPNIFEQEDYSKIKNKSIDLKDKSDEINDPLFELDESKSVNEMRTVTKSRKLTKLSSRVKRTSVAKAPQAKVYR